MKVKLVCWFMILTFVVYYGFFKQFFGASFQLVFSSNMSKKKNNK